MSAGYDAAPARAGDRAGARTRRRASRARSRSCAAAAPGSTCSWWTTARAIAPREVARAAGVPVLRHAVNLGVGAALQTGFRWAVERRLRDRRPARRRRAARAAPTSRRSSRRSRGPLRRRDRLALRGARAAIVRRSRAALGMLLFSAASCGSRRGSAIADTTSGFRAYGRGGDGGLPARVPEGLPRRAAPDRARAARLPAARGAGRRCASAQAGTLVLHARQVALLPVQEPARVAHGAGSSARPEPLGSPKEADGVPVAHPDHRRPRRGGARAARARSRAPPAARPRSTRCCGWSRPS